MPKKVKVRVTKSDKVTPVKFEDNITNPKNKEYVAEVAFSLDKTPKEVTQAEFSKRYKTKN